ncbi:MAG: nucleotidyltransferase family protein [Candidatus Magasanikbacteria bacterium]|nr:nucleotidyltransferase family protein [Candidatus Magasanikbacteria bacterium]
MDSIKIKQAVILCAGLGTRMRPLTDTMPKPMIPFFDKPLLEWNIEQFKKHGVTEFFINLYHLPDIIRDYFGDGKPWGVKINYFQEKEALGTAGGVKDFESLLDSTFFVIYGDMFSLMDYSKMEKEFANYSDALGIQKMQKTDYYQDADVAEVAADNGYVAIHPKPHTTTYANAYRMKGVFILKKEILRYVPANTYFEIGKQLLPDIVRRGLKFYSYECDDYTKCIDDMEKYKEVEEFLKKNLK